MLALLHFSNTGRRYEESGWEEKLVFSRQTGNFSTQAHLSVPHPHSSKWPNIYHGWKLSYYAFLLRMQRVGRKKKNKKKITWQMVLWTLYRETVNSIHYLWGVVVRYFLGDRGRKGICCFLACHAASNSHRGEIEYTVNIIFLYIL